jgi:hypothetical protein
MLNCCLHLGSYIRENIVFVRKLLLLPQNLRHIDYSTPHHGKGVVTDSLSHKSVTPKRVTKKVPTPSVTVLWHRKPAFPEISRNSSKGGYMRGPPYYLCRHLAVLCHITCLMLTCFLDSRSNSQKTNYLLYYNLNSQLYLQFQRVPQRKQCVTHSLTHTKET